MQSDNSYESAAAHVHTHSFSQTDTNTHFVDEDHILVPIQKTIDVVNSIIVENGIGPSAAEPNHGHVDFITKTTASQAGRHPQVTWQQNEVLIGHMNNQNISS